MPWNGSGTFSRDNGTNSGSTTWADDAAAAIKITTGNHDTHDEDIATGITACVTKNGESKMTADFVPSATDTYDLGTTSLKWEDLVLNNDAIIGGDIAVTGEVEGGTLGSTLMGLIYPVGSIYQSTVSTNPNTLFGVGTWTAMEDSFLIGASATYAAASTGGSADAIVVAHSHTYSTNTDETGSTHALNAGASGSTFTPSTSSAGSSGTNANMPPYVAIYMWERTA